MNVAKRDDAIDIVEMPFVRCKRLYRYERRKQEKTGSCKDFPQLFPRLDRVDGIGFDRRSLQPIVDDLARARVNEVAN